MKKLMTIGLAAALMFAMAGKVSATPLETSGEYRARLWLLNNYFESGKQTEFWDQRFRLTMTWPVAEGVKFQARADILEGYWGDLLETPTTTGYDTIPNSRSQISFDQVNLSFTWPNSPVTITVGRQGTTWGPGFFVSADNRDRFKIAGKVGAATIFYTYDKYTEVGALHDTAGLDDRSQHTVGAVATVAGWNVGGIFAIVPNGTIMGQDTTLNVVDFYGMGKVGPVGIKAEAVYGFGKTEYDGPVADLDLSGLGFYAGASMPAGPVNVGLDFAYVSGNDPSTTKKNEGALRSEYQSPFWSIILFNNLDYSGFQGESNLAADGGMANAWGIKPSVSMPLTPGLSLYGALVYASRNEKQLNPQGNVKDGALGTEIDVVLNYAITPNVTWTVGGGYLVAGDYFGTMDDPWGMMSAFTVKF